MYYTYTDENKDLKNYSDIIEVAFRSFNEYLYEKCVLKQPGCFSTVILCTLVTQHSSNDAFTWAEECVLVYVSGFNLT